MAVAAVVAVGEAWAAAGTPAAVLAAARAAVVETAEAAMAAAAETVVVVMAAVAGAAASASLASFTEKAGRFAAPADKPGRGLYLAYRWTLYPRRLKHARVKLRGFVQSNALYKIQGLRNLHGYRTHPLYHQA